VQHVTENPVFDYPDHPVYENESDEEVDAIEAEEQNVLVANGILTAVVC